MCHTRKWVCLFTWFCKKLRLHQCPDCGNAQTIKSFWNQTEKQNKCHICPIAAHCVRFFNILYRGGPSAATLDSAFHSQPYTLYSGCWSGVFQSVWGSVFPCCSHALSLSFSLSFSLPPLCPLFLIFSLTNNFHGPSVYAIRCRSC